MKIALIQITSVLDPSENLNKIEKYIIEAKGEGAEKVFLPEVFYSMSDGAGATPYLVADNEDHLASILNLAKKYNVFLIGGTVAFKSGDDVLNRSYIISPDGEIVQHYDKMNLFSCNILKDGQKTVLDEAAVYSEGMLPAMYELEGFNIGMSICFDLRFPELYRYYFSQGANLLTIPAAFTVPTGKAHWEVLLRARAIENQSYVVAANQFGIHNDKISTWGHSLIISPWGEVLADAGEGEKVIYADISLDEVNAVRNRMNVALDKRIIDLF